MENQNPTVKWPFGAALLVLIAAAAAATTVAVDNNMTVIDGVKAVATTDRTINLDISKSVEAGARILLKTKTTATEMTIPGQGFKGASITGVAGKTMVVEYVYDGESFIQTAAAVQID